MNFLRRIFGTGRKGTQVAGQRPPLDLDKFRHRLVVAITPRAAEKLRGFRQEQANGDSFVRVDVLFQGPTGHYYDLRFDDNPDPGHDLIGQSGGLWVVINSKFVDLLDGTIVDWRETPDGSGFWFTNPNAVE